MNYEELRDHVKIWWRTHIASHLTSAALSDPDMLEAKFVKHWMDSQLKVVMNQTLLRTEKARRSVVDQTRYSPLMLLGNIKVDAAQSFANKHYVIREGRGSILYVEPSSLITEELTATQRDLWTFAQIAGGVKGFEAIEAPIPAKTEKPVPVETAEAKAARIKAENIADWTYTAHKMARYIRKLDAIKSLASDYAKRKLVNPTIYIPVLAQQVGTDSAVMEDVVDIYYVHLLKLLGMFDRMLELYKNPDTEVPFILPRSTAWASGNTYKVGDYEKMNNVTYWCKQAHTASDTNKPDVAGGDPFWNKVLLNNVPGSFTYNTISYTQEKDSDGVEIHGHYSRVVTPKNANINVQTGAGFSDYLDCVAQEFGYHDAYHANDRPPDNLHDSVSILGDFINKFFGIVDANVVWKEKVVDDYEIWTSKVDENNPTSIVPAYKVYSAKVTPVDSTDSNQVDDALAHQNADWTDLYSRYFDILRTQVDSGAQSPWLRN